jgi:hypothetical protein
VDKIIKILHLRTVPKYNLKVVGTDAKPDTSNRAMHNRSHSLGTDKTNGKDAVMQVCRTCDK